jgi:hypothetical protein
MITTSNELLTKARELAAQLQLDIAQASTRLEHIRLTARANEAALLLQDVERLFTTGEIPGEINDDANLQTFNEAS